MLAGLFYGRIPVWPHAVISLGLPLALYLSKRRGGHTFLQMDAMAIQSRLIGWNAGFKVCVCGVFLVACVAADSIPLAIAVAMTMAAVSLVTSPVGVRRYLSLLLVPITFVILSGLVLLVDISPEPLGLLDIPVFSRYLSITPETQVTTGHIMAKAVGALCCLYTLSLSTPVFEIIACLRKIKVPALVVELMVLIYRYVFILFEALHSMTTSSRARLGDRSYRSAWRSFTGIGSNLLVRAFVKAGRAFDAMEARCYGGEIQFLERKKPVRGLHILSGCILAVVYGAVLLIQGGWR